MLKTSESTECTTWLEEDGVGVGDDIKAGNDGKCINGSEIDGGEVRNDEVGKKVQKTSKFKNLSKSKKSSKSKKTVGSDFLTPGARLVFTKLRQVFVEALILYYFNLKHHIRVEMDISGYAISRVLNQLTWDDSNW